MTDQNTQSQAQQTQENKPNDKEYNFRQIEARLQQERQARLDAERRAQEAEKVAMEAQSKKSYQNDDDDSDEPYVDHKRLSKKFDVFEKRMEEKIEKKAEEKARMMVEKERKDSWIKNNPDFYDVLQHAERFAQQDPELAETILQMPEGFERQKLVYKNIKALGLHKPAAKEPSIQEKVDANRRSPYYQPTGVGTAPYQSMGDFSKQGQKQSYDKMQELKNRLRLG